MTATSPDYPDWEPLPGLPVAATAVASASAGADGKLIAVTANQAIRLWWVSLTLEHTDTVVRGDITIYLDTVPKQTLAFFLSEPCTAAIPERDVNMFLYFGGVTLPRGANLWLGVEAAGPDVGLAVAGFSIV